jgi:hypothetical protein
VAMGHGVDFLLGDAMEPARAGGGGRGARSAAARRWHMSMAAAPGAEEGAAGRTKARREMGL